MTWAVYVCTMVKGAGELFLRTPQQQSSKRPSPLLLVPPSIRYLLLTLDSLLSFGKTLSFSHCRMQLSEPFYPRTRMKILTAWL